MLPKKFIFSSFIIARNVIEVKRQLGKYFPVDLKKFFSELLPLRFKIGLYIFGTHQLFYLFLLFCRQCFYQLFSQLQIIIQNICRIYNCCFHRDHTKHNSIDIAHKNSRFVDRIITQSDIKTMYAV